MRSVLDRAERESQERFYPSRGGGCRLASQKECITLIVPLHRGAFQEARVRRFALRSRRLPVLVMLCAPLALLACGQSPAPDTTAAVPDATAAVPDATAAPISPTTQTAISSETAITEAASSAAGPLSSAEVYARVSPSIAFIETPGRTTGSGILIEGDYVVTNFHVVWPYEAVRVVFPDGTELANVPVAGWDPMTDLAVLGPVDVAASPLVLEDGEDIAPGAELFLVGYPAEVDQTPQTTITRGILSRYREWERLGITLFQTDAAIAGGQSGGALVDSRARVIGISTFSFSEAGFGLATSAADNAPIVEKLIQGVPTSEWVERLPSVGGGDFRFDIEVNHLWDVQAFVLDGAAGTNLDIMIHGPGDGMFGVSDSYGPLMEIDDSYDGVEEGSVEMETDGFHFLQVELASGVSSTFALDSSARLRPFEDPDDGRTITTGETVEGIIDYYLDADWYSMLLRKGETVTIHAEALSVDPAVAVYYANAGVEQIVSDDDSGGGLFGLNAELVFQAPHTGEFFIAVTDAVGYAIGGYYLAVS